MRKQREGFNNVPQITQPVNEFKGEGTAMIK